MKKTNLLTGVLAVMLASALGAEMLPVTVCVSQQRPGLDFGLPSYFDTTIISEGKLAGTYDGWCVDTSRLMDTDVVYEALLIPATPEDLEGVVDFPENIGLVLYIINQNFPGKWSMALPGTEFTYGDVQRAIWELLDDTNADVPSLGPWEQARVDEILVDALMNGVDFTPGCDEKTALILRPLFRCGTDIEVDLQFSLIEIPVVCEEPECFYETAWAAQVHPGETRFVEQGNWGTYVTYMKGEGTEEEPKLFPLYAGQFYLSGFLKVYDMGDKLYVQYTIDLGDFDPAAHSPDCMPYEKVGYVNGEWVGLLEYHLHVANTMAGFNSVRTYNRRTGYRNPIPGAFEYKAMYDPENPVPETAWIEVCIKDYTDPIYIAAHAVMGWCGYPVMMDMEE